MGSIDDMPMRLAEPESSGFWFEMEKYLRTLPEIRQARIINIAGKNEPIQLVAAISCVTLDGYDRPGATVVKQCREMLKKSFANHGGKRTVPQRWVVLDDLPSTPAAAIDDDALVQRLVALGFAKSGLSRLDLVRSIVARVLHVPFAQVLPNSSFIRLGGNSIVAIEVMSRCMEQNVSLTVPDILGSETLIELERMAVSTNEYQNNKSHTPEDIPLPSPRLNSFVKENGLDVVETAFPCSPVQEGILISQIRASDTYLITCVVELTGPKDHKIIHLEQLEQAWTDVIARHAALRTVFIPSVRDRAMFDQIVLRSICPTIKRLGTFKDGSAASAGLHALDSPTLPTNKPGHILTVCDTDDGGVFCRLDLSHAIMDGMSAVVLLEELGMAYRSQLLTTLQSTFKDYITSQGTDTKNKSLAYWISYLEDIQPCIFPPMVDQSTKRATAAVRSVPLEIDGARLSDFSKIHGVTIPVIMQAVWAMVLRVYLRSDDVCFGYLGSGRDMPLPGIDRMVGVLINLLVCRVKFDEPKTTKSLLHSLQSEVPLALANQSSSLAEITHGLDLGGSALFEYSSFCNVQGTGSPQRGQRRGNQDNFKRCNNRGMF